MKRLFIILLSVAALISASFFVSCSSDDSSSGGGGDNYYQGENYGGSSGGNISDTGSDDDWEDDDDNYYVPSTPQNVTTKATSSSSIEVSWDAVDGADSYVVYYRLSLGAGNESYERDGTEAVKTTSNTSVSIYDLTEWKIYIFFVTAQNSAGESFAKIVFDYPCSTTDSDENDSDTTTLSAPTGLTANAASSSSIELSWDSVSGATTYYVYTSESSSYSTSALVDATISTSMTIVGLEANTKYYFWVKAFNGTTISDYSTYDYATTKAGSSSSGSGNGDSINESSIDLIAPGIRAIGTLEEFFTSDGKGVKITIGNDSSHIDSRTQKYRLYRSYSQYDGYELVKEVSSSGFSYVIEDRTVLLQEGTYYYYKVAAVCGNSEKYSTNGIELYIAPPKISVHAKNANGTIVHGSGWKISFDNKETYYPINLQSVNSVSLSNPPTSGTYSYSIYRGGNYNEWTDYSAYTFEPLYTYSINVFGGAITKNFQSRSSCIKSFAIN